MLAPYAAALDNPNSAHPTLRLSLPASFLDPPQEQSSSRDGVQDERQQQCRAGILVRMPPGVFLDTSTFLGTGASGSQRRLASHVDMLNASTSVDSRLARNWDFTRVELERAVGFSLVDRMDRLDASTVEAVVGGSVGMPSDPTLAAATARDASPDAKRLLVREFTAAVVWLRQMTPDQNDAIEHATQVRDQPSQRTAWSTNLEIPLHARYPLPIPSKNKHGTSWRAALASLVNPTDNGNYRLRLLEQPQAFWSCARSVDQLATGTGVYERMASADAMLSPMHKHLSLASILGTGGAVGSGNDGDGVGARYHQVYRLRLPARTSREPFRLRVPTARQEHAAPVVVITLASLVLAALVLAACIRREIASLSTHQSKRQQQRQARKTH